MSRSTLTRLAAATAASALALSLAACGSENDDPAEATSGADAAFPVTVENCGAEVTFEAPPASAILLKSASVTYLHELDLLTEVVTSRAGAYPREYYDDETWAALEEIPVLSDEIDAGGHLLISKEVVLAEKPDLVLGQTDNLDRNTLGAAGVPLLEEPAFCPNPPADPSFETISEQFRMYGQVFGIPDRAEAAVTATEERLEQILADVPEGESRTAAVLYPTIGGGVTYAYGTSSMSHPQLEAAGFTNVFGDVTERVFEVTLEEIIGRNPDVLILLYSDGDPDEVKQTITEMRGARALTAVQDDAILVQLLNFSEPPTPLAIDGLERIVDRFQR